jgi:hypothetical protein
MTTTKHNQGTRPFKQNRPIDSKTALLTPSQSRRVATGYVETTESTKPGEIGIVGQRAVSIL